MRSQMRLAAALWSLNFLTGCTPGRLLQIATSRFAGQDLASSANSGWLLKLSNGVVVAAAASSGVACAVMLLWVSIVKVVIVICPLFRALRGHDMDHSARLETQGNSEQYRRWRTCGDGRRPEPRMIQNCLAFRPQERDACPQVDYVYLVDRPIATIQPSNGKMYFLHDDRFGTPQRATDNTQAVAWSANYQPFGYTSTGTGLIVQNLRLPGQEFEVETSWNHNGFRDYVPTLGRYLEPDPIGIHTLASGTGDYMYARNSPINFVDPQGFFPIDWEKLLKAIALGIGTVAPNYLTSPPPPADPTPIVRPIQSPDPLDALRGLAGKDAEVLEKLGSAGEAQ